MKEIIMDLSKSVVLPILISILTTVLLNGFFYRRLYSGKRLSEIKEKSLSLSINERTRENVCNQILKENERILQILPKEISEGSGMNVRLLPMELSLLREHEKTIMTLSLYNVGNHPANFVGIMYSHANEKHQIIFDTEESYEILPNTKLVIYVSKVNHPSSLLFDYPGYGLEFGNINVNPPRSRLPDVMEGNRQIEQARENRKLK